MAKIPLSRLASIALCGFFSAIASGCFRDVMVDETFAAARRASKQAETLQDFEMARSTTYAGVGQLEGLLWLRPNNETGLFMLTKAWVGVGQAFALDDYEAALERDDEDAAAYHQLRARAAFLRAQIYGLRLLAMQADGFEQAATKQDKLRAWLKENITDRELAEPLLWLGIAWLSHISVDTENAESISRLWVGVELIEHVVRLDEKVEHGMAHAVLGGYHARLMGEIEEAKPHFDRALAISGGRFLPVQLTLAVRYHCTRHDGKGYEKVLRQIVEAGDPMPEARLANLIAQRKARRYLTHRVFSEECGFNL
jgi:hypothetical protein